MERPALLRIQIRALIVAAEGRPLNIMFPMISDVFEFQAAKEAGIKEIERMKRLGQIVPSEIRFGLMLEVPAMAFRIRQLSGICDLFLLEVMIFYNFTLQQIVITQKHHHVMIACPQQHYLY